MNINTKWRKYSLLYVFIADLKYSAIIFSLHMVLVKYLTIKYYFFSPGKIYISIGIIMLFLTIFGSIIYSFIKYEDLTFFKISFDFSKNAMSALFYIYSMANFGLHIIYLLVHPGKFS